MTGRQGVTLLEMLIVVALIGLLAGISFPSVSAGLETLRLASAASAPLNTSRFQRLTNAALRYWAKCNAVILLGPPAGKPTHASPVKGDR